MKIKQIVFTVLISALTTVGVVMVYGAFFKPDRTYAGQVPGEVPNNYKYAGFTDGTLPNTVDFTQAAAAATPAVVHIKTRTNAKTTNNGIPRVRQNPFSDLFDDEMMEQLFGGRSNVVPEQRASGSGVIISTDGHIVTNNHVVQNADEINVTLANKKTYKAKVIGTDPSYDLAVIKIEAAGLPYLIYGNSDDVKIGQWVLAIGYPLNLETTVTAGIISAKSRSLGLNRDRSGNVQGGVEAFIQTDAAVNMGNSGGALINTEGKLIGVNSAIASPTGYYSGYSYAIPVSIVSKVVDDIIKFGTVQRGYLDINFVNASEMTEEQKKREGVPVNAFGIYVSELATTGGAYEAGIRKGDIILSINGVSTTNSAEMQEQISRYKPGDKVPVKYSRNGKENTVVVTLKNKAGNYDLVKRSTAVEMLGAEFLTLDPKKAKDFGVNGGVIVRKINPGAINDQTRMKDGFIILKINGKNVNSVEELQAATGSSRSFTLSGFYPGFDALYEYPITLE